MSERPLTPNPSEHDSLAAARPPDAGPAWTADPHALRFSPRFDGPENEALRAHLRKLVDRRRPPLPLYVDTVLGFYAALDDQQEPPWPSDAPPSVLLFDFHRVFLFDGPTSSGAGIRSVLWGITDGYPLRPFQVLKEHSLETSYQFLYDLDTLNLLPTLWAGLQLGQVIEISLSTGEIHNSTVPLHAREVDTVRPVTPDSEHRFDAPLPEPSFQLRGQPGYRQQWVGPELRAGSPPSVDGLLSEGVGYVRRQESLRDPMSFPTSHATVAWSRGGQQEICYGKSVLGENARKTSIYEALERYQIAFRFPSEANQLIYASREELQDRQLENLDPYSLFYGKAEGCPEDVLPVYRDEIPFYWTWVDKALGTHSKDNSGILAPAQEVWFQTYEMEGESLIIHPSTNGCALGGTPEEAAVFALLEAIERDAYMTTWYLQRPARAIDLDSIQDEDFQVLRYRWELAYPHYRIHLFDITHDLGIPVVVAVADRQSGDGPRCFHGAACHVSVLEACKGVVKNIAGFHPELTPERRAEYRELLGKPEDIHGPRDHFALYALDESYEAQAFLGFDDASPMSIDEVQEQALIPLRPRYEIAALLEILGEQVQKIGGDLYLKDLTHPQLAERGLHCVKAITPGLYPLWFGSRARRFRVTDRLRKLAKRYLGRVPADDAYNLTTHPFT
ncbi:MAG: YcaO-like family protein [Acidobacteriota bacterium]